MAHAGVDFFARAPRSAGRVAACVLAFAAVASVPARPLWACPEPRCASEVPPDIGAAVTVVSPAATAWPDAVEAIRFELDQAGYGHDVASSSAAALRLTLQVHRDPQRWALILVDEALGTRSLATGPLSDDPEVVAVHAAELVYAALATRRRDAPVPTAPAAPPDEAPPTPDRPPAIPPPPLSSRVQLARSAPTSVAPPDAPRRWKVGLGITASTMATLGVRLGVHRRWTHAELALHVSGGQFAGALEEVDTTARSSVAARGYAGFGLATAYVFRPGRRVRPRLGITSGFVVPIVRTSYRGSSFAGRVSDGATRNDSGTDAGLLWTPALQLGIEIRLTSRLALRSSVGPGATLRLRDVRVANGAVLQMPRWFLSGATGLMF